MSLKYKIFTEKKLFVDILTKSVVSSKLYEFHNTYKHDPEMIHVNKAMTYLVDVKFEMSIDEVTEYIDNLVNEPLPPKFKWAIITDSPNSTMFSMLIMEEPYFKNKVEVFSTVKGATKFLDVQFDESEFDEDGYFELQ